MDIKFSVWDWDKWNEDDHMGDTEITVNTKGTKMTNLSLQSEQHESCPAVIFELAFFNRVRALSSLFCLSFVSFLSPLPPPPHLVRAPCL